MVYQTVSYMEIFSVQMVFKDSPKNLDTFSFLTIVTGSPFWTAGRAKLFSAVNPWKGKTLHWAMTYLHKRFDLYGSALWTAVCNWLCLHLSWRTASSAVCNLTIYHPSHYNFWNTKWQDSLAAKLHPNSYTLIPEFYTVIYPLYDSAFSSHNILTSLTVFGEESCSMLS